MTGERFMIDQLDLFENKPHIKKENIKSYNSCFRVKIGYRKPLEILDERIDLEFLKERLETY